MMPFLNKPFCCLLFIILMGHAKGFSQNKKTDSSEIILKTTLVDAGWLRFWAGEPMQNIGGNEVAGYTSVEKRIIFLKDLTFEMNVYADFETPVPFERADARIYCRQRKKHEEVSVFTGNWSVKKDSVYLHYRLEKIYDSEEYATFNYARNFTRGCTLKSHSSCKLNHKEVFIFKEETLCSIKRIYECYR
ncbi:MAG: hypothetical protein V4635_07415 [Bacteroidota bacterium]